MNINKSFTIIAISLSATLAILTLASSPKSVPTTTTVPTTLAPAPSTVVTTSTTTTTTTTVAPTTTIDPLVIAFQENVENAQIIYPRCAEWLPTLLEVGGKLEDWGTWSTVLWTESRCKPTADNGACVGLTQIYYEVHKKWLNELGYTRDDLYDPVKNLRFAVMLQDSSGWSPWAYLHKP